MNCREGDLAIVVRAGSANAGKVVTCLRLLAPAGVRYVWPQQYQTIPGITGCCTGPLWLIDRPLLHRSKAKKSMALLPFCNDAYLRPLRGGLTPEDIDKELEHDH